MALTVDYASLLSSFRAADKFSRYKKADYQKMILVAAVENDPLTITECPSAPSLRQTLYIHRRNHESPVIRSLRIRVLSHNELQITKGDPVLVPTQTKLHVYNIMKMIFDMAVAYANREGTEILEWKHIDQARELPGVQELLVSPYDFLIANIIKQCEQDPVVFKNVMETFRPYQPPEPEAEEQAQ